MNNIKGKKKIKTYTPTNAYYMRTVSYIMHTVVVPNTTEFFNISPHPRHQTHFMYHYYNLNIQLTNYLTAKTSILSN